MRVGFINLLVMTVWVSVGFGTSNQWVVLSYRPMERQMELPALAIIDQQDDTGLTWKLNGRIPFNGRETSKQFVACFARQQWVIDKSIGLGESQKRSELLLFKKGERRLLVMLWEARAGETGFSLGEESKDGELAKGGVSDKENK